ncbi:MAG: HIT family protein [Gallionellaceae bacterium]|jgi:diadenosine tetraphosphate (Ap4A) HIT family hydrolase
MTCELCIPADESLLWQGLHCRVILVEDDDYPGFCRVIWNEHIKEMTDLSPAMRNELMNTVFAVELAVREVMNPEKINLASLGNMTPHLHWHVIPRYLDDKNFPNPVWGAAVRNSRISKNEEMRDLLSAHIHTKLTA